MARTPLQHFALPLPSQPPFGDYAHTIVSETSNTTAFDKGLAQRDSHDSKHKCIVCGRKKYLNCAHIIPKVEEETWADLRQRGYVPNQARSVEHEPRNGLSLCPYHHKGFDGFGYFIRYMPQIEKFVFVNFSRDPEDEQYHGKAVFLDPGHRLCPMANVFVIHEMRVRGRWPFLLDRDIAEDPESMDWLLASGGGGVAVEDTSPTRTAAPSNILAASGISSGGIEVRDPVDPIDPTASQTAKPGRIRISLDSSTIEQILAASRASASWKVCEIEGTSWEGTADENARKYRDIMDI
ncbi:hypothetical protein BDZ97DRAFT_1656355 [Flammula alnicola]|nr:hypothetical protein BDZ97DRAFT_1656355 [Flammula alnicola]